MTTNKVEWKIPFDKDGNHVKQVYTWRNDPDITYKDRDFEFTECLKYIGMSFNNSTVNTHWEHIVTHNTFTSNNDMLENALLKQEGTPTLTDGNFYIHGTFCFKKRGDVVLLYLKR